MSCTVCEAETDQVYCRACARERFISALVHHRCPYCGLGIYVTTGGIVASDGSTTCPKRPLPPP